MNLEMMHLAIDAIGAKHSGSATVLTDILNSVIEDPRVSKITIFCSPSHRRLFELPTSEKLIEAPRPWIDANYFFRMIWYEWLLGLTCRFLRVDVLLIASNFGKALFGIPHVTNIQQSLPFSEEAVSSFGSIFKTVRFGAVRWQMKRSCQSAACVTCQSLVMKEWLTEAFHLDPARVQAIYTAPRPLEPSNRSNSLRKQNLQEGDCYRLLYVGSDYPYKKIDTAINALELIRRRFPATELTLTLPKNHHWSSLSGINCVGYLNDERLAQAYHDTDILVLPSLVETVGLPTLEAMSLGTPVLVADRPYAHDICENAALFFDPLSPEDLAEKAIKLLTDQVLRKILIERGLALIERRRAEKPYQKIVDILIDVATSSRSKQTPNYS